MSDPHHPRQHPRPKSLRRQLLLWLALPLIGMMAVNVWLTYTSAVETADLITDRTLLASARVIAEAVNNNDGVLVAPIPPSALEMLGGQMLAGDTNDRVIYRVMGPHQQLLAGYADSLPLPPDKVTSEAAPLYFTSRFRDQPVRAVAIMQTVLPVAPWSPSTTSLTVTLFVGQTLHGHQALVTSLWLAALRGQGLLVLLACGLAAFGLQRSLGPLLRLGETVRRRPTATLTPLPLDGVQRELHPLVASLNASFDRVARQIEAQRRFVANAAHQLRTPLALLKLQTDEGLRAVQEAPARAVLSHINGAVDKLTHLTAQLLALARAEQGSDSLRMEPLALETVLRETLEQAAALAVVRGIDLGLETGPDLPVVRGHRGLLHEMFLNLVDNALRHTPKGGVVTARLLRVDDGVGFTLDDTGPGIPELERGLVFERFYRHLDNLSDGSGLGLAVVKEIVTCHRASITLSTSRNHADFPGLRVEVHFPPAG